jgi:hypothetical protein
MNPLETLLAEMIEMQKKKLLATGARLIPNLTWDDLLQPNDFPLLETHAEFRYEEGILAGLLSVQSAMQALKIKDNLDGETVPPLFPLD